MSSDSREVHAATKMLAVYKKTGDIQVIKNIDFKNIKRYDVWRCVFEKEMEAYQVLQEKEMYSQLMPYRDAGNEISQQMLAQFCISILTNIVEFKSPMSLDDGIHIILDILGESFTDVLIDCAKENLNRRIEIVKPYSNCDDDWVKESEKVLKAIEKIKAGGD